MSEAMTPTEELVMEVLAGRYRTGEAIWTFSRRQRPVMRRLEARGWVFFKEGIVEDTLLVGLTEAGKAEVLSPTYIPPFERTP